MFEPRMSEGGQIGEDRFVSWWAANCCLLKQASPCQFFPQKYKTRLNFDLSNLTCMQRMGQSVDNGGES